MNDIDDYFEDEDVADYTEVYVSIDVELLLQLS